MQAYVRYAVYYLPDDDRFAEFGANWLGWDVRSGSAKPRQSETPDDYRLKTITETPRRYGFHGTLKPPFRLAPGKSAVDLKRATQDLASDLNTVTLTGLKVANIGRFLAFVPESPNPHLSRLAERCVTELDHFRDAPTEDELNRRRAAGLTGIQDALLKRWGYPYVLDEFRFHITLTGKLGHEAMADARRLLGDRLVAPPKPFRIASISLVGQRQDDNFELIQRFALRP